MLGIDYDVIEYFQYENKEQLQRELQLNQIGTIEFIPNEKWIKYTINLKNCIRLKDLMFWIEKGLVLITIGQILRLCEHLINKVIELQHHNLDHFYLTSNRIWLKLNQNSKQLTISYVDIEYKIVFTGFQCPIFENQSQQQYASKSIRDIMNSLIKDFGIVFNQFKYSQQLYQSIIPYLAQYQDIFQAKNQIGRLLTIYQSHPNLNDYSKEFHFMNDQRKKLENMIAQQIVDILQSCKHHEGFLKDQLIIGIMPMIVSCIREKQLNSIQGHDFNQLCIQQEIFWKNLIKKQLTDQTQNIMSKEIEKFNKQIKLQISEEDEQMMIDQIHSEIMKSSILKYFFNSYWLWMPSYQKCEDQFRQYLIPLQEFIIKERVTLWIKEMLLQFINELI